MRYLPSCIEDALLALQTHDLYPASFDKGYVLIEILHRQTLTRAKRSGLSISAERAGAEKGRGYKPRPSGLWRF